MRHTFTAAGLAVLLSIPALAETNEIIISATRIDTPIHQMATSVNVVTGEAIENRKQTDLPDLLQTLPGVSMSRSGGPGQATQIYLRGAKPQHTLVMVDGVRMNGQLDLSGYNMTHLQLLDIDRIEVLKGPHSPLYGSDAMAGVINIVTKKGEGDPSVYIDAEGGSYGTWRTAAGVSGSEGRIDYSASVSHFNREGESALKNNDEKDGTENTTVAARLGILPTDYSVVKLTLRYIDATTEYDDGFGTAHSDFKYDTEQLITRAETTVVGANETIESKAGVSYLMLDRYEYGFDSTYNADTLAADWANTFFLHDNHTLLAGIDGYYDDFYFDEGFGAIDDDLSNFGVFGSYQVYPLEAWVMNLGARHDEHSEFEGETTWQASSAYTLDATGTRFKAAYATGFKAPISYQLFASFGNPDLQPETSEGWEAGIEQTILTNRLLVGATVFHTDYEDLIDYDFGTATYQNIAEARTDGAEVYSRIDVSEKLYVRVGYTYLDNDDLSGGSFTLRRPTHQIDADANYALTDQLNVNLYAGYVGNRDDIGGVVMDEYVLVNMAIRYRILEQVELYGRIENLLDEDYETVAGYNTDDLSAYAGVKINLW
jgi:vitamin B12 transporter